MARRRIHRINQADARKPNETTTTLFKQNIGATRSPPVLAAIGAESVRRIQLSPETKEAYLRRDRSLDNDPDSPPMPPEYWEGALVGKYYRPGDPLLTSPDR